MCRHISTVSDRPGYTFGYIPANNYRGPKPSVENRCPPSQLVVMRWLHICRSTKSRRVWWNPRTLPVADERASFRPTKTQAAVPDETLAHVDEGASPDCIE